MVSRSQINYLMSKASNQFMIRTLIETNKNLTGSNQKMVQEIRELSDKCWQQRLDLMEIQGDYLRLRGQLNAYGALVFFDNKCRNEVVGLLKENKYGLTKTVMEMIKTEDDKTRGKRFKIYYEKNVLGFKTEIETKDGITLGKFEDTLKQIYGKRNAAAHPPMEGTKVRIMEKHFTESETQLLESVCACALLKFEVI